MTSSEPVQNLPVFVENDLRESCMHDAELIIEIANTALEDIPLNFQRLELALQGNQLADACRAAHSIKSVARQIGGRQLAAIMQLQERGLHLGQRPAADLQQKALTAWPRLEAALRGILE